MQKILKYCKSKPIYIICRNEKKAKKRTRQLAIFAGASPTIVAVKVLNF